MKRSRVRGIWRAGAVARLSGWLGEASEVGVEGGRDSVMFLSLWGRAVLTKRGFRKKFAVWGPACVFWSLQEAGMAGVEGAEAAGGMIGCRGQG